MESVTRRPEPDLKPRPDTGLYGYLCTECFEFVGSANPGWLERWLHRRKYGHNPIALGAQTKTDRHGDNVRRAKEYKEQHR